MTAEKKQQTNKQTIIEIQSFKVRLFLFQLGPTNEGVHKGPPKSSYAIVPSPAQNAVKRQAHSHIS